LQYGIEAKPLYLNYKKYFCKTYHSRNLSISKYFCKIVFKYSI